MEEGSGVEPHARRHPWVSNPVADRLAVPSSMERRPRLELGKTGFAVPRFDRFSIRRLAGDPRFELGNSGFGVRCSPNRACPPWWPRRDLNSHVRRRRFLRPVCMRSTTGPNLVERDGFEPPSSPETGCGSTIRCLSDSANAPHDEFSKIWRRG